MEFQERLRTLRKEHNLTQKTLAEHLNYGYTAISNYESGKNKPSINDLKKIASFFNVSLDYLLCVNDIRNPYIENASMSDFDYFKSLFFQLDDYRKKDLFSFLQWLLYRQKNEPTELCFNPIEPLQPQAPTPQLHIAEPRATYHINKPQQAEDIQQEQENNEEL